MGEEHPGLTPSVDDTPPTYAPRRSARSNDARTQGVPRDTHSSSRREHSGAARPPRLPRRLPKLGVRSAISVLAVTMASGLLFATSAQSNSSTRTQSDLDLAGLVRHRQETVTELQDSIRTLNDQIASHVDVHSAGDTPAELALAQRAVSGPGLVITLSDAPGDTIPEGTNPNDLVIHQQDIDDVMNALWSGGAEAMTVQGVRVTSRTVVRCIGNVILVGGTSYSPPYKIAAIGDISRLKQSVESNPRVVNYREYVARYGLGWELRSADNLNFPASSQDLTLRYAQVVDNHG